MGKSLPLALCIVNAFQVDPYALLTYPSAAVPRYFEARSSYTWQ